MGCRYADKIVHREFFANNPDFYDAVYSSPFGIYKPHCGLDKVHLSYGHDEYMYQVCKKYLPPEALFIIRYHSFYACHTDGEYAWMLSDKDVEMMKWLKAFSHYDLHSKAQELPDLDLVKPYYQELIAEYFPPKIGW